MYFVTQVFEYQGGGKKKNDLTFDFSTLCLFSKHYNAGAERDELI